MGLRGYQLHLSPATTQTVVSWRKGAKATEQLWDGGEESKDTLGVIPHADVALHPVRTDARTLQIPKSAGDQFTYIKRHSIYICMYIVSCMSNLLITYNT